jgi:hypothetical protein
MHLSTWEEQLKTNVVALEVPLYLPAPGSEESTLRSLGDSLERVPTAIVAKAGRPPKNQRRRRTQRYRRVSGPIDLTSGKKSQISIAAEGDDILDIDDEEFDQEEHENEEEDGNSSEDSDGDFLNKLDPDAELPSIYDEIPGTERQHAANKCSACGNTGHYYPKCRRPSIWYILHRLGVVSNPPPPNPKEMTEKAPKNDEMFAEEKNAPKARKRSLAREPDSGKPKTEGHAPSGKAAKIGTPSMESEPFAEELEGCAVICVCCQHPPGDVNWRYSGFYCETCGSFCHFTCSIGRKAKVCVQCKQ